MSCYAYLSEVYEEVRSSLGGGVVEDPVALQRKLEGQREVGGLQQSKKLKDSA